MVWFENNGHPRDGNLWKRHAITSGGLLGAYDVAIADFDGDGLPDVVASSWRLGNSFVKRIDRRVGIAIRETERVLHGGNYFLRRAIRIFIAAEDDRPTGLTRAGPGHKFTENKLCQ